MTGVSEMQKLTAQELAELGRHADFFNAWFEDGKKVRHEDIGGIQCLCGWTHGPVNGTRPWEEFNNHRLEKVLTDRMAQAWQKGHDDSCDDFPCRHRNPYVK